MNNQNVHTKLIYICSALLFPTFFLVACGNKGNVSLNPTVSSTDVISVQTLPAGEVQVIVSGGHDSDPRDAGRPIVLIASALSVSPEVFREAFNHVRPAMAGFEPNPIKVKSNKAALLNVLGPYGVTNDDLDTVSNFYRFNGSAGETWPQTLAAATAIVTNGDVTGFTIANPGSGYSSPPAITLAGIDVEATAEISFSEDFDTNGSVIAIRLKP